MRERFVECELLRDHWLPNGCLFILRLIGMVLSIVFLMLGVNRFGAFTFMYYTYWTLILDLVYFASSTLYNIMLTIYRCFPSHDPFSIDMYAYVLPMDMTNHRYTTNTLWCRIMRSMASVLRVVFSFAMMNSLFVTIGFWALIHKHGHNDDFSIDLIGVHGGITFLLFIDFMCSTLIIKPLDIVLLVPFLVMYIITGIVHHYITDGFIYEVFNWRQDYHVIVVYIGCVSIFVFDFIVLWIVSFGKKRFSEFIRSIRAPKELVVDHEDSDDDELPDLSHVLSSDSDSNDDSPSISTLLDRVRSATPTLFKSPVKEWINRQQKPDTIDQRYVQPWATSVPKDT
jgi:hypothetical protein